MESHTAVVIITAQNTLENAIEAMKRGAFDYLTKPFDLRQIEAVVAKMARIPPKQVTKSDAEALKGLQQDLKRVVYGQDNAIEALLGIYRDQIPTDGDEARHKTILTIIDGLDRPADVAEIHKRMKPVFVAQGLMLGEFVDDYTVRVVQEFIESNPGMHVILHQNPHNLGLSRTYVDASFMGKGRYFRLVWGDDVEPKVRLLRSLRSTVAQHQRRGNHHREEREDEEDLLPTVHAFSNGTRDRHSRRTTTFSGCTSSVTPTPLARTNRGFISETWTSTPACILTRY